MPATMIAAPAAVTAAHPAAAVSSAQAVQPSLAEQLSTFGRTAWNHLAHLDAREASLNLLVSAGVLIFALGIVWVLRRLFDAWVRRFSASCGPETPDEDLHPHRVAGVTWALLRLVVLGAALLFVIGVWGIDPWAWLAGGAGAHLVRLVLIVVLATALWEVAGFVIRRLIDGFATRSRDPRRSAQLRTLGPLLTGFVQSILLVVGLITFLSELGLKIAPLLASAGVVGIAIGFGAQTLVKDFLTGLFLIAEDVVSVGDNVMIGSDAGKVEAMTLRTIRLRAADGTLHIFPYSEAQVIHNRTKGFSSYLFEFTASYDVDVDRALKIMADVGAALRQDPEFGKDMTEDFVIMGVDKLTESGVVLKGRLTTNPGQQWRVGREYNRRALAAFMQAGVQSPYTTVQLMPDAAAGDGAATEPRSFTPPPARPNA